MTPAQRRYESQIRSVALVGVICATLAVVFCPTDRAFSDFRTVTLCNRTTNGPCATLLSDQRPGTLEHGNSRWQFQGTGTWDATVTISYTLDGGTTNETLVTLTGPGPAYSMPVCGACTITAAVTNIASGTVEVTATVSGQTVAVITPAPTDTPTPTVTPTPTRTHTPTATVTVTPTVTPTP